MDEGHGERSGGDGIPRLVHGVDPDFVVTGLLGREVEPPGIAAPPDRHTRHVPAGAHDEGIHLAYLTAVGDRPAQHAGGHRRGTGGRQDAAPRHGDHRRHIVHPEGEGDRLAAAVARQVQGKDGEGVADVVLVLQPACGVEPVGEGDCNVLRREHQLAAVVGPLVLRRIDVAHRQGPGAQRILAPEVPQGRVGPRQAVVVGRGGVIVGLGVVQAVGGRVVQEDIVVLEPTGRSLLARDDLHRRPRWGRERGQDFVAARVVRVEAQADVAHGEALGDDEGAHDLAAAAGADGQRRAGVIVIGLGRDAVGLHVGRFARAVQTGFHPADAVVVPRGTAEPYHRSVDHGAAVGQGGLRAQGDGGRNGVHDVGAPLGPTADLSVGIGGLQV